MRISDWSSDVCSSDLIVSYSELLGDLGFRFTRPKMRAVCKTLAEVDRLCAAGGQPDLAVLVVRESDRLPGQGWWSVAPRCFWAMTAHGRARAPRALSASSSRRCSIIGDRKSTRLNSSH